MTAISTTGGNLRFGRRTIVLGLATAAIFSLSEGAAQAASRAELERNADAALQQLYAKSSKAREISAKSRAVLIFPTITKAGFMIGGQGGLGVLRVKGRTQGYFKIAAGSVGMQIGAQKFSYAMFFITQSSLDYLKSSDGWAFGSGPSVVVIDEGAAKSTNTTTLKKDVYSFAFGQKGLMAGLGLEGSKISPAHPK